MYLLARVSRHAMNRNLGHRNSDYWLSVNLVTLNRGIRNRIFRPPKFWIISQWKQHTLDPRVSFSCCQNVEQLSSIPKAYVRPCFRCVTIRHSCLPLRHFGHLKMLFFKGHESLESRVSCFRWLTIRHFEGLKMWFLKCPETLGTRLCDHCYTILDFMMHWIC
jgi:hypothetical protein